MGKRIVVVGAGAVGGYVGGHLARTGEDVTFVDPWPENVERIRTEGFDLKGYTPEEHCVVKVPALHITELQSLSKQAPVDIAFVSMKSYDTEWATMMIKQYLAPGGFVVSLQNGINEERVASVVGWGKTVGCIASKISVELTGPGQIRRTVPLGSPGHIVFRVGEVHGRITDRVNMLGDMISRIDTCKVTTNLWGERWSKLVVNSMRNGLSAATGQGGNANDRMDHTRRFAIRLGSEAVRIGKALGFELENIGNIPPDLLEQAGQGNTDALAKCDDLMISSSQGKSDDQRPSMGQDMMKGRRTEIEFLNGLVVEKGDEIGIPAPANTAMVDLVKRVERGELEPSPDHIARLSNI